MFALRSILSQGPNGLNASPRHSFLLLSVLLVLLVGLAGCGDKNQGDVIPEGDILATVNGATVTSREYRDELAKLMPAQLPLNEDGVAFDMATDEGKAAYLDILINKELMAQKASQLGYDKEADVLLAKKRYLDGAANQMLWNDVVQKPNEKVTEEELQALYSKLGTNRECLFLITNYEKDALEARERAMKGEDWNVLVAEYHDGIMPPTGLGTTNVIYGYTDAFFDEAVFAVGVGEVTAPIETGTGVWLLKVLSEKEGPKPDLETKRPSLLDIVQRRKIEGVRLAFREKVRKSHNLEINEETLLIAYNGLDQKEMGRDPRTGRVKPIDELKPLQVAPKDLDRIFYSYTIGGEKIEATLGEYKEHYDRMGGFQRPYYAGMLGGMRTKITQELERAIITDEARSRGYFEHPEVLRDVNGRISEMSIGRLLDQAVPVDKKVDPDLVIAFFEEHKNEMFIPEKRDGLLVICRDEATAAKAIDFAQAGKTWDFITAKLGTDEENKAKSGRVTVDTSDSRPRSQALFSLTEKAQISEPFAIGDGRFGVVTLLEIHEAHPAKIEEVSFEIGAKIRNENQEKALAAFVETLRADAVIEINQDKLAGLPSYQEVTSGEEPQNVVSGS